MDESQTPNPFASPAVATAAAVPEFDPDTEIRDFHLGKSIGTWLLVCGISGAPSFFFGHILGVHYVVQSIAMVVGILTFVAFYVYVDSREWTRRKLMDRSLRNSVRVGYITRVAISIIFPIAMFMDMWCGLLSTSATSALFGNEFMELASARNTSPEEKPMLMIFTFFYLTTLVQGVVLNIVLGAYALIVYAITLSIRSGKN